MLTTKPNRWHPCLLPDDYLRKLRQDVAEADAMVKSKTLYVSDADETHLSSDSDGHEPERTTHDNIP